MDTQRKIYQNSMKLLPQNSISKTMKWHEEFQGKNTVTQNFCSCERKKINKAVSAGEGVTKKEEDTKGGRRTRMEGGEE